MGRVEYHHDSNAPDANSLIPAASAIVVNETGAILLHQRSDNELWSIPGGTMEVGESIGQTVVREVKEETGLDVEPRGIVGIYSDPGHVVAYDDGEVRQQFSVCFACSIRGGEPSTSDESLNVRFFTSDDVEQLPMSESIRRRIRDFLASHKEPVIA